MRVVDISTPFTLLKVTLWVGETSGSERGGQRIFVASWILLFLLPSDAFANCEGGSQLIHDEQLVPSLNVQFWERWECSILRKLRMWARYVHSPSPFPPPVFKCSLQLICVCARIRLAAEISQCCGFRCKGNTLHLSCRPIPTPSCCEEASPWAPLTFPPSPSWP